MANAFADVIGLSPNNGNIQITLNVTYVGDDIVGGPQQGQVVFDAAGDASAAVLRTSMSNAIATDAVARGFTVLGTRMSLPSFQKG